MTEHLYPIAVVASELDCGVRDLERRCNGAVVRDENLMRCIPGNLVRELIEERDSRLAAQREKAREEWESGAPAREEKRRQREQQARERQERQAQLAAEDRAMEVRFSERRGW